MSGRGESSGRAAVCLIQPSRTCSHHHDSREKRSDLAGDRLTDCLDSTSDEPSPLQAHHAMLYRKLIAANCPPTLTSKTISDW
jgi:hypothetical protein